MGKSYEQPNNSTVWEVSISFLDGTPVYNGMFRSPYSSVAAGNALDSMDSAPGNITTCDIVINVTRKE